MTLGGRAQALDGYNYRHFRLREIYNPDDDGPAVPGTLAPDFTLPDLAGESVSLAGLRGQPVVLEFGSAT